MDVTNSKTVKIMNNSHNPKTSRYKTKGPCRNQVEMRSYCIDDLIPKIHRARDVWMFVTQMDCSSCFEHLRTYKNEEGRSACDPKVLLAIWILAILDGVTSARQIETLCREHNAYVWLAGGAPVNRDNLSVFRALQPRVFEDLLTSSLAVMVKAGVVEDKDFAQDGTKIKANAGFNSYRRESSLEELKVQMQQRILEIQSWDLTIVRQEEREAAKRQAQERLDRICEAHKMLQKERELKVANAENHRKTVSEKDLGDMRASTTDPDARKMKFGDGGFRLGYNVQFATGMTSRVIFGATVGTTLDPGTSPMLMNRVHHRLGLLGMPNAENWIGDSAYSSKADVEAAAANYPDTRYFAPPKVAKDIDPKKPCQGDSAAVCEWRKNIGDEDVEAVYKLRCSTAEFSNAQMKNRGFAETLVRGIQKVKSCVLLSVVAQNVSRYFSIVDEMFRESIPVEILRNL